jgi:chromosome segregation ATPase
MFYTLGDAARATGRSKPTIARAVKSGLISGSKAEDGSYSIDASELHRVFPRTSDAETDLKQPETRVLQREVELLREQLADRDDQIRDLRTRLDREAAQREQESEERRKLMAILTDQRPAPRASWWQRFRAWR